MPLLQDCLAHPEGSPHALVTRLSGSPRGSPHALVTRLSGSPRGVPACPCYKTVWLTPEGPRMPLLQDCHGLTQRVPACPCYKTSVSWVFQRAVKSCPDTKPVSMEFPTACEAVRFSKPRVSGLAKMHSLNPIYVIRFRTRYARCCRSSRSICRHGIGDRIARSGSTLDWCRWDCRERAGKTWLHRFQRAIPNLSCD